MEITKQDRNIAVKEYEYGEIEGYDLSYLDIPSKAEFCYSDANELIYENYDNLISHIENSLIPYYIMKKENIDSSKSFYYVRLTDILQYKLSEKEVAFVINYLEKKEIYVVGESSTLEGEFSNYICKRMQLKSIIRNLSLDEFSNDEQIRLFKEYQKNPSLEIKQQIVLYNVRLVSIRCQTYSRLYDIDFDELYSYGIIGLLKAIPKFDVSLGNNFSTFALYWINNEFLNGIKVLKGCPLKDKNKKYNFIKELRDFETNENQKISNDITLVNHFIEQLIKENIINEKDKPLITNWSKTINYLLLQDNIDDVLWNLIKETDEDTISKVNIKIEILKALDTLDDKTKKILKMRFGISPYDKKCTLREIGKYYNISNVRVKEIERIGLSKLKVYAKKKSLKDYYD